VRWFKRLWVEIVNIIKIAYSFYMLLPSLLEYSVESLETKFSLLQEKKLNSLHLDFVLPQFAKDRNVMTSLSMEIVFSTLQRHSNIQRLDLTIHLMGTIEDLFDAYKFFEKYSFNPLWNYKILIPAKYIQSWRNQIKNKQRNVQIGSWYDLDEWDNVDFSTKQTNLLMTVKAGKSGQKLTTEIQKKAILITKKYPQAHFILDGGWEWDFDSQKNVDHVSYSSFWKSIGN
jgi:pentose-5-phosphate-3-epimerase